ncbi:MAG: ADP-ribosylglycohydrolase family protein [Planctomycetota bacterium]
MSGQEWLREVEEVIGSTSSELVELLRQSVASAGRKESTKAFADSLGLARGVTGYSLHTVPVAIHAWLTHSGDYEKAVSSVIECGGDADTTAAIVGGIVGAGVGKEGIPRLWLESMTDWPRSAAWIEGLGRDLAAAIRSGSPESSKVPEVSFIASIARNMFFLLVVLFHGFRRLAPPY